MEGKHTWKLVNESDVLVGLCKLLKRKCGLCSSVASGVKAIEVVAALKIIEVNVNFLAAGQNRDNTRRRTSVEKWKEIVDKPKARIVSKGMRNINTFRAF